MDTATRSIIRLPAVRTRRRHAPQFRAQVVAACLQPGVSISAVALANGLNANLVRRWVKENREGVGSDVIVTGIGGPGREAAPAQFVAVAVETAPVMSTGDIRPGARRWCASPGRVPRRGACAQWLRWHDRHGRRSALRRLGIRGRTLGVAGCRREAWFMVRHIVVNQALKTATLNRYGLTLPWALAG